MEQINNNIISKNFIPFVNNDKTASCLNDSNPVKQSLKELATLAKETFKKIKKNMGWLTVNEGSKNETPKIIALKIKPDKSV